MEWGFTGTGRRRWDRGAGRRRALLWRGAGTRDAFRRAASRRASRRSRGWRCADRRPSRCTCGARGASAPTPKANTAPPINTIHLFGRLALPQGLPKLVGRDPPIRGIPKMDIPQT